MLTPGKAKAVPRLTRPTDKQCMRRGTRNLHGNETERTGGGHCGSPLSQRRRKGDARACHPCGIQSPGHRPSQALTDRTSTQTDSHGQLHVDTRETLTNLRVFHEGADPVSAVSAARWFAGRGATGTASVEPGRVKDWGEGATTHEARPQIQRAKTKRDPSTAPQSVAVSQ